MENPIGLSGNSIIHYEPTREEYTVTNGELEQLANLGKNQWKDFSLVCISIGIPCIINAITLLRNPFEWSISLFLNSLFGLVGICLFIFFVIMWRSTNKDRYKIISNIKSKPKMQVFYSESAGSNMPPLVLVKTSDENKSTSKLKRKRK
ncbi:MAG: hypothetical protein ABSC61_10655 [Anaerolineales bacterium]